MAQSVEHILGKDEVGGSSPLSSSKNSTTFVGCAIFVTVRTRRPQTYAVRTKFDFLKQCSILFYQISMNEHICPVRMMTEHGVALTPCERGRRFKSAQQLQKTHYPYGQCVFLPCGPVDLILTKPMVL